MKTRKILSLALALVMVLALFPVTAGAGGFEEVEIMPSDQYTLENGVLTIHEGVTKVTALFDYYGSDTIDVGKITRVVLPNSVTTITDGAFKDFIGLTSVNIPSGVTGIGDGAFDGCTGLTSITIPDGVTLIGSCAFVDCNGLTNITIPDSVTEIRNNAFDGCSSLASVIIPDSVTYIEDSVFAHCTALTSVNIPSGVTGIGDGAFDGCTGLTSITIPDGVTRIMNGVFNKCGGLTSVVIPASVTEIRSFAFCNCTSLTDVYFGGTEEQWNAINVADVNNDALRSATIHYNSGMPKQPAPIAYPSTQKVDVDGKAIEFQCYALKDANGNDTNYIKLRDLADILNGSAVQFEVGWNGNVTITTGKGYTKNGSEQSTPFSGQRTYQEVTAPTLVNGEARDLAAFVLNDDQGGGYTYYQLRDLGKALGFNVGWAADKGIFVETDKPYDANN